MLKKLFITVIILIVIFAVVAGVIWFLKTKNQQTENTGSTLATEEKKQEAVPLELSQFAGDQDRDGIADEKEKALGLSDRDFDTDGDGISDKDEIEKWKTDPTKPDTDSDGYWDGFEIIKGYNPLGAGKLTQ